MLRPVRRGDQRAAVVTARSIGPLGLAGRQRSQPVPGQVRVLPPFLSRKHLPSRLGQAARDRRAAAHADPRTGHRIRLAARVCRRRRRPLDRLAGNRAPRRRHGPHLAARTRPAGGDRARHRTHGGRPRRRRPDRRRSRGVAAAGLVDGRRTAAGGAGVAGRRPRRLPRPRPGEPGRRVRRVAHRTARPAGRTRWPRCNRHLSSPIGAQWLPQFRGAPGDDRWWCC